MAQETVFQKEVCGLREQLIRWRRSLHQMPETGTVLPQTMSYIGEQLEEMGISTFLMRDLGT